MDPKSISLNPICSPLYFLLPLELGCDAPQPPEKALASPPVRDILPSPRLPLHLTLQTNMASLPEEGTLFQGVRGNGEFHHSLGKRGMSGNSTTLVNWILTHETVWPV